MRVIEAAVAGLIVGLAVGVIAWRVDADIVLMGVAGFLLGFAAWGARGKTTARYGRRGRRH